MLSDGKHKKIKDIITLCHFHYFAQILGKSEVFFERQNV